MLPNSVAILDPDDGRVVTEVPVGVRPADLAVGAGSVWVANLGDNTVTEIGARSRRVAGRSPRVSPSTGSGRARAASGSLTARARSRA